MVEGAVVSAEVLRRAAALMRERAEAACPGRWVALVDGVYVGPEWDDNGWLSYDAQVVEDYENQRAEPAPDMEHIASWHPAVALAVADWLAAVANDQNVDFDLVNGEGFSALAVARAYLGEQP